MLEAGLESEARALFDADLLKESSPAYQAIGYKELIPYLRGEEDIYAAADRIKQATRRYAKRQMTWFRRTPGVHLVEVDGDGTVQTREQLADLLLPRIREWLDNSTQLAESAKKG
jgi:tRNA dimethylallyltransferase